MHPLLLLGEGTDHRSVGAAARNEGTSVGDTLRVGVPPVERRVRGAEQPDGVRLVAIPVPCEHDVCRVTPEERGVGNAGRQRVPVVDQAGCVTMQTDFVDAITVEVADTGNRIAESVVVVEDGSEATGRVGDLLLRLDGAIGVEEEDLADVAEIIYRKVIESIKSRK